MNQTKPVKYRCIPSCPYRNETPGMCNAGAKQIPIKDGRQCLYPKEALRRNFEMGQRGVDYKEIATHKWNLNQKPPTKVQRLLKIIDKTFN